MAKGTLKFLEKKGGVTFYLNENEVMYQQLGMGEPFKVRDGKMTYRPIDTKQGYQIRYNSNGIEGYSVWKGKTNLEDRFWTYDDADKCRNGFIEAEKTK